MSAFVFSCITPHGGEIIPELCGQYEMRMEKTRKNMGVLGQMMAEAVPDVLIILTPHGTRINGQFSVSACERMEGTVEEHGLFYSMERSVDKELAIEIVQEAAKLSVPIAGINYGTSGGPLSCLQLDWGAIVPLRFMPKTPIVVITPSREISYENHLKIGEALRNVANATSKKMGLIASCDWSHAHDEDGPYGFHPDAKKLDQDVVKLFKENHLEEMMKFDDEYIENAKPDGIWQTLILAGAIKEEEREIELLSYEAPTYFGLICAAVK